MAKCIQIDSKLFYGLYRLIVLQEDDKELYQQVKTQIENKFDKLVNHELYSKYKTADTEVEREQARQEYLESVGIHKNFIWENK